MSYRNLSTLKTVDAYQFNKDDIANNSLPQWVQDLIDAGDIEFKYDMLFHQDEINGAETALANGEWLIKNDVGVIQHLNGVEFQETYQEL